MARTRCIHHDFYPASWEISKATHSLPCVTAGIKSFNTVIHAVTALERAVVLIISSGFSAHRQRIKGGRSSSKLPPRRP